MNTLFIQFYSKTSYPPVCFQLGNGFSDTYDLCKDKGDFYWVEHDYEKIIAKDLPIEKGIVYISSLFVQHLYMAYLWAKRYPDIKFIVGGPGVHSSFVKQELPKNLTLTDKTVEEWFDVANFSGKWKLNVPSVVPANDTIYFTYVLDNTCYWSKCNFCCYKESRDTTCVRLRKDVGFEFEKIDYEGMKMIRLGTDAVTPKHIKILNDLPLIKGLDSYKLFLRAGKKELSVIKSLDSLEWLKFVKLNIGLEFPTDRMWKYMKKGYNTEVVIELLNILQQNFIVKFLLGWNNLTKGDLINLENFMKRIPLGNDGCCIKLDKLYAIPGTYIHDTYKKGTGDSLGPFYMGFKPILTDDQIVINKEAEQIIIDYAKEKGYFILNL